MAIRVLLANDQAIVREGLGLLLRTAGDMVVVGEAANGAEAIQLNRQLRPDVVVMGILMPEMNGVEATAQLVRDLPGTRVVILSLRSEVEDVVRALKAGAMAFLLKGANGRELVAAVRTVHKGQRFLSHGLAVETIEALLRRPEGLPAHPLDCLSLRERQVLQMVVEGKSNADVAARLQLSVKTVETYRSRIMAKLNVRNLPSLVKLCLRWGITSVNWVLLGVAPAC
jgi:DNA-binding NarL/FixJ family response regulator